MNFGNYIVHGVDDTYMELYIPLIVINMHAKTLTILCIWT